LGPIPAQKGTWSFLFHSPNMSCYVVLVTGIVLSVANLLIAVTGLVVLVADVVILVTGLVVLAAGLVVLVIGLVGRFRGQSWAKSHQQV
jgi:hypothetical protein